jgi:hypothetical protein
LTSTEFGKNLVRLSRQLAATGASGVQIIQLLGEVKSSSSCKGLKGLVFSASAYATVSFFVIGVVSTRNWASCRNVSAVIGMPRQSFDAAIRLA